MTKHIPDNIWGCPYSWLVFGANNQTKNSVNNSKHDQPSQLIWKPTEWTSRYQQEEGSAGQVADSGFGSIDPFVCFLSRIWVKPFMNMAIRMQVIHTHQI